MQLPIRSLSWFNLGNKIVFFHISLPETFPVEPRKLDWSRSVGGTVCMNFEMRVSLKDTIYEIKRLLEMVEGIEEYEIDGILTMILEF